MLKRNIAILLVAQVIAVTATISLVMLGGIVGREMAPAPALAALPLSLFVVGTAVGTVPAAWLMSRIGRARGFACGAAMGLAGTVCAALSWRSRFATCWRACCCSCCAMYVRKLRRRLRGLRERYARCAKWRAGGCSWCRYSE